MKNKLPNYVKSYFEKDIDTKREAKINYPLKNNELVSIYVKIAVLSELQAELIDEANEIQNRLNPKIQPTEHLAKYRISLTYFSEQMLNILFMDKKISGSNAYQELSRRINYNIEKSLKHFK